MSIKTKQQQASTKKELFFALFIFAFSFLLYSNTLHHGFVMDDGAVITNHSTVQKGVSGIIELFEQSSVYGSTKENFGSYRPLTMSFFAIEKQFFGSNSNGYHAIQILLYSILCVLLYILLKKIIKDFHPLLPFITILLFISHPIHTEVVANIKSADEILCLLFASLATLFAFRFIETSRKFNSGISFLFFLCALFSKENATTFLLLIPMTLYFFSPASKKNILLIFSTYAIATLAFLMVRFATLDKAPENISIINNALISANSFSERYATISLHFLNYLRLLCFPANLCWDYSYNQIPIVNFNNPLSIFSTLIIFFGLFFSLRVFFKMKRNNIDEHTHPKPIIEIIFLLHFIFHTITIAEFQHLYFNWSHTG